LLDFFGLWHSLNFWQWLLLLLLILRPQRLNGTVPPRASSTAAAATKPQEPLKTDPQEDDQEYENGRFFYDESGATSLRGFGYRYHFVVAVATYCVYDIIS